MSNDTRDAVGTVLVIGSAALEKVTLKGIGLNGGDPLDASHLGNVAYLTKKPQSLLEVMELTGTAHYAPENLAVIVAELNKNQSLVLTFPGVGTVTFWGYLQTYEPDEGEIGSTWNASFTVQVTNLNATDVETGPVFAAAT